MAKFIYLAHGEMNPNPAFQEAHAKWWASLEGHIVDSGNPLFNGHDVSKDGAVREIGPDASPALGYSIIEADSMDEAVSLLADSPMDMFVYETMPM